MHEQAWIDEKRRKRMEKVDEYDPEIRALIHEYGLSVVQALWDCGVKKPRQMKHVVETVLDEFSPTRGSYARQGLRVEVTRGAAAPEGAEVSASVPG
jgi:hypothetical protein